MSNYENQYNTYGYDITKWKTDAKNYIYNVLKYDSVLNMLKYKSAFSKNNTGIFDKYKINL